MNTHLSIAFIARDKFSQAVNSLSSLCSDLPENSRIIIFDSGYPDSIMKEFKFFQAKFSPTISIIATERFANTNYVWNQFTSFANANFWMCLENDVQVETGCIKNCLKAITDGLCDVAVPIVYENQLRTPHFNPKVSEIIDLEGGSIESHLERGREDAEPEEGGRVVKHLERHCFLMSQTTGRKLGKLDEQMFCRTDYDMSFACHKKGITIGIPVKGSVTVFTELDPKIDTEFFDYRWNIAKVELAHRRLIAKWRLIGFKKTIDHAYQARKYLTSITASDQ